MVTFEYGEICLIRFEISDNGPLFSLIRFKKKTLFAKH